MSVQSAQSPASVATPASVLTEPVNEKVLPRPWTSLLHFDELESTQHWARQAVSRGRLRRGSVVWAERQSAGRGRLNHAWDSAHGGLYVTVALPYELPLDPSRMGCVSLLAAMACVEALHEALSVEAQIKWPNDIFIQGRKVAGLLGEIMQAPPSTHHDGEADHAPPAHPGAERVLIGLGLNWKNEVAAAALAGAYSAINLAEARPGLSLSAREPYLMAWLRRLDAWHARLCRHSRRGLAMLLESVENALWGRGQCVRFEHTERGAVEGVLLGLTSTGAARVQLAASGEEIQVQCGWQSPPAA